MNPEVKRNSLFQKNEKESSIKKGVMSSSAISDISKTIHEQSTGKKIAEFMEGSTLHGVPVVASEDWAFGEKNPFGRRLVWGMICFGILIYLIIYTNERVAFFGEHPTVSSFTLETQNHAIFPAVTFCALNVLSTQFTTEFTSAHDILFSHVEDYGHEESDFVTGCTFDKRDCMSYIPERKPWWSSYIDRTYGRCFTFDPENYVNQPNRENGLELRLSISPTLYQAFSEELGFVVKVHKSKTRPNMNTGVKISSGIAAELSVRKISVTRPPYPYTSCLPTCESIGVSSDIIQTFTAHKLPTCLHKEYVRLECTTHCASERVKMSCDCGFGLGKEVSRQCGSKPEDTKCIDDIFQNVLEDGQLMSVDGVHTCAEHCPMPCTEENYDMALSTADFPAKFDNRVLLKAHAKCMNELHQAFAHDDFEACKLNARLSSLEAERDGSGRRLNNESLQDKELKQGGMDAANFPTSGNKAGVNAAKTPMKESKLNSKRDLEHVMYRKDKEIGAPLLYQFPQELVSKDVKAIDDLYKRTLEEFAPEGEEEYELPERNTIYGCKCQRGWTDSTGNFCEDYCCNPDDERFDWCMVEETVENLKCQNNVNWGYCREANGSFPFNEEYAEYEFTDLTLTPANEYSTTTLGCKCQDLWIYEDQRCDGHCCNPDDSPNAWCFVQDTSCQGLNWGYCGDVLPVCAPQCPQDFLGDGVCDEACQNQACNFDEGDCGVLDPDLLGGGAASQREIEDMIIRFSPSEECNAVTIDDAVEKYQSHASRAVDSSDTIEVVESIGRVEILGQVIKAMAERGNRTVGAFTKSFCGENPNAEDDSVIRNWDHKPDEKFIQAAWSHSKSEAALLRVYFSEFNVQDSDTVPQYDELSLLAELGGIYGLLAGFSMLTVVEFIEFFSLLLIFGIFGCNKRKSGVVYAVDQK